MLFMTDVEYYDIIEWIKDEVRARTASSCRQSVLTVNWATDQVHTVSTDLAKGGCSALGPLNKPRVVTLENGDPIEEFFNKRKEMLKNVSDSPMEHVRSLFAPPKTTQTGNLRQ
jgi:hypothetical protein